MNTLGWVALGALLGAIVAVALIVWLLHGMSGQITEMLRQWLDTK